MASRAEFVRRGFINRAFHGSRATKASHFDTQALVVALEKEGLSREQAVGITGSLEEVIRDSVSSMVSHLVTRAEVEKYQYTQKVCFPDQPLGCELIMPYSGPRYATISILQGGLTADTALPQVDFAKVRQPAALLELTLTSMAGATAQIRSDTGRETRLLPAESGERTAAFRRREAQAAPTRRSQPHQCRRQAGFEFGKRSSKG